MHSRVRDNSNAYLDRAENRTVLAILDAFLSVSSALSTKAHHSMRRLSI
jgi:hypothetical protein